MKNLLSLLLILLILSCKSRQDSVNTMEGMQEETGVIDPTHNSQNSLDWNGTYSGILPCGDCMGIQTTITLKEDNSFEKTTVYLGKSEEKVTEKGTFSWQDDGQAIAVSSTEGAMTIYKVEETQLRMLNQKGEEIEGDLANNYVLQKSVSPIVNKYWKATEIMGSEVVVSENMKREPHLIIRSNGEFSAGGGCNSIFGQFKLEGKNRISFSKIGMSEMACMFDNFDQELVEVLNSTSQFIMVDDEHMQLVVGKRAPLARFKVVYF